MPLSESHPLSHSPGTAPESEVERLLAAGKAKQAVALAKEAHKKCPTPQSEEQLVRAYVARIEQFQSKGMAREAQDLLALVSARFPARSHDLAKSRWRAAIEEGRLDEVLAPLALAETVPNDRAHIETLIRQHLTDLPALAACPGLPADHPLRVAASALWRAFQAVTTGPVEEAAVALAEVSHRSPLADWKMLVRAIAAFYRNDDPAAGRALAAIPPESAVSPLALTLPGMLDGNPPRAGFAGVLAARVMVDHEPLRAALGRIDTALQCCIPELLKQGILDAVRQCAAIRPDFLERLKQHISAACLYHDAPADNVVRAMGTTRKDAFCWRLLARASEQDGALSGAALYWERFLRHAIDEGMFADHGPEAAAVWLHIAQFLSNRSPEELAESRRQAARQKLFTAYYDRQPPEIARLRPQSDQALCAEVLDPGAAYRKSAQANPLPDTFRQWFAWSDRAGLSDREREDVALEWHRALPRDPEPLVILSSLAERRDALARALKWLGAAEAIDRVNPRVRQARVRLTFASAWRHFAGRKAHLVEKDLAELQAVPGMTDGDRGAVHLCMRAAWQVLCGQRGPAAESVAATVARLGTWAGPAVVRSIAQQAKLPPDDPLWPPDPTATPADAPEIARAEVRIIELAADLGLKLYRPARWDALIRDVLRATPCPLSNRELLLIGDGAQSASDSETGYLASSAGLARADAPATTARFLLLRARSLGPYRRGARVAQCLAAAAELARSSHDEDLLGRVMAEIDRVPAAQRLIARSADGGHGLSGDALDSVLKGERAAVAFPTTASDAEAPVVAAARTPARGPLHDFAFPLDDDDAGPFDDAQDDDDGSAFGQLPPGLEAALLGMLLESGLTPEEAIRNPRRLLELIARSAGKNRHGEGLSGLAELLGRLDPPPTNTSPGGHRRRRGRDKKRRGK